METILRGADYSRKVWVTFASEGEGELIVVQCSMFIFHRWWRFAQSFSKDAAPKAHPEMTNDR
jgi:hypothetical protein